jgi:hypothetical protein
MRVLSRWISAAGLLCVVACDGVTTAEQTVPKPQTPVQKATASPTNPDAAVLAEFNARLEKYLKFQRDVADDSPALEETANPGEITAAQDVLAAKIRTLRKDAKRGDIFTPQVAELFRRLMYPELKGREGRAAKADIAEEPVNVPLRVNAKYPSTSALPTVPANLLANLPQLPEDVEYRIVDKHLILRDVDANIIVDYIPDAIR